MKELKIKLASIDDVHPYELNSKKHEPDQVRKIAESIKQFGWDQPIVVDANGVVIKGHGRRLAAIELGLKSVPVLVRDDLSEDAVRAARLADNRVAVGDIDTDLLRTELSSLDYDLSGIFDDKELEFGEADLGEMDDTAFIEDIDSAVNEQEAATKQRIEELAARKVAIAKALGFKDIRGEDEIAVARFMTYIEKKTSMKGEEAFIKYIKSISAEKISHA